MEGRRKSKTKKPAQKPKIPKKKKTEGPTCSMFLAELTKKLSYKKKTTDEEVAPKNIVQSIIVSLTNALPVIVSKHSPEKRDSPMNIENLQEYAPELLPNDTLRIPGAAPIALEEETDVASEEVEIKPSIKLMSKIPRMPVMTSDIFKLPDRKRPWVTTQDAAVNTCGEHDVASEIAKHVGTLKRISLIAEEFNQKTAKTLKEIVDSVQEDLIKKLEEAESDLRAKIVRESSAESEASSI